jgi:hypothetical protein
MRILIGLPFLVAFACSSPKDSGFGTLDSGASSSGASGFVPDGGFGTSDTGPNEKDPPAEVYGHSPDTLYKLEPNTKAVTSIGTFSGCDGSVIDLALNEKAEMYGVTFTGLFRIDKGTAACTKVANDSYPNSLSFVPKGTLDPNEEALVGYEDTDYVRINLQTGKKSIIGAGALKRGLSSSGDIVSVKGGPTYLTVKGGTCTSFDCLVEVDPVTGAVTKELGSIGFVKVFGLAFWAGEVYGFTNQGELFQVTVSGGALTTKRINIPGAPSGLQFYGAGSSTSAPVKPR